MGSSQLEILAKAGSLHQSKLYSEYIDHLLLHIQLLTDLAPSDILSDSRAARGVIIRSEERRVG